MCISAHELHVVAKYVCVCTLEESLPAHCTHMSAPCACVCVCVLQHTSTYHDVAKRLKHVTVTGVQQVVIKSWEDSQWFRAKRDLPYVPTTQGAPKVTAAKSTFIQEWAKCDNRFRNEVGSLTTAGLSGEHACSV